ncbi:MAG: hypothetical protein KatS3mg068_2269 [Candidatus Sericytochromatia bacterium]|nr:MAG: hypothetical protein KatS3mg068_2269 [Candidatus Sericytochromatia bacterium]
MYKIIENNSQKIINIEEENLESLFKDIAFSFKEFVFGSIITNPKSLRNIYIIENSMEELIIQWIGELNRQIVYHDWIFNDFKKIKMSYNSNEFSIRADLTGEGINSGKHKIIHDTTYLKVKNLVVENVSSKYKVSFNLEV